MTPLQTALGLVGYCKQADKATPAANPAFAHGVSAGPIILTDIEQAQREVTGEQRIAHAADRTGAPSGADFSCPAYPKSIGALLHAVFGDISTSGAGPYVHVFAPGASLPYYTFWRSFLSEITRLAGSKVDELTLKWTGPKPIEVSVNGPGCSWAKDGALTFVPVVDDSLTELVLTPVGGSMKVDVVGAAPATLVVTAGEVKFSNGSEIIPDSTTIENGDVAEGLIEAAFSLTCVPEDLEMWQASVTGAVDGTAIDTDVLYGSLELNFIAGTDTLKVEAVRVPFVIAHPDLDPKNGAGKLELAGIAYFDGTDSVAVTLTNTQATY